MPVAVAGAVAFLGSLFLPAAAGFTLSLAVGATVLGVVAYQAKRVMGLKDKRGAEPIATHQSMVRGTVEPRKIVYGEAGVSGPLFYMNSAGSEYRDFYIGLALTGHEIDSLQGVWLDDKYVPVADIDVAGDGSVDTDSNSHGYAPISGTPVLYLRRHLGTAGQTTDSALSAAFPSYFTANHRGRGCALLVVRAVKLEGADEVWQKGFPANVMPVIRGKKYYDPRLDSTFTGAWGTGSGAHRLATPSTWAWGRNPALALADYLIDADLGPGIDSALINYSSFATAADVCDASVSIPGATTEPRYRCDGVLSTADSHRRNIEKLLSAFDGTLRFVGGLFEVTTGAQTVVATLTEAHLTGPLQFRRQPERSERYNAIRGTYFDPQRRYKESQYLTVSDTALQSARDDGLELFKDLDLPLTSGEYNAQRLAIRAVNKADLTGILVFPTGYNGLQFVVGDAIQVTHALLGWSAKRFRIIGMRHRELEGVEIIGQEDDTAAYADPASGDYGTRSGAGTIDFPDVISRVATGGGSLLGDPFFSRRTAMWNGSGDYSGYFWRYGLLGVGVATISRTGGVHGGVLQISGMTTAGGGSVLVQSMPVGRDSVYVTSEYVRLNVRVRKRNNPTLTTGLAQVIVGGGDADGQMDVTGSGSILDLTYTMINGWTVDEWQTFETTFQMVNVAPSFDQKPYCIASVGGSVFSHDVQLEFDAVNVTRIA